MTDLSARLGPEPYTELSTEEIENMRKQMTGYQKSSTINSKLSRIQTFNRLMFYINQKDAIRKKGGLLSAQDIQSTLLYIATNITTTEASLTNYISNIFEFIGENRCGNYNQMDESLIRRRSRQVLESNASKAARPVGVNDFISIKSDVAKAAAIIWANSGLRAFHMELMERQDLALTTKNGVDELGVTIPNDKNTETCSRQISIRCGCYTKSNNGTKASSICLIHDDKAAKGLKVILARDDKERILPSVEGVCKETGWHRHSCHVGLIQAIDAYAEKLNHKIPKEKRIQRSRVTTFFGWSQQSKMIEYYTTTQDYYNEIVTRIPINSIVHNLQPNNKSLKAIGSKVTKLDHVEIEYFNANKKFNQKAHIESIQRQINDIKEEGAMMSMKVEEVKTLLALAKLGLKKQGEEQREKAEEKVRSTADLVKGKKDSKATKSKKGAKKSGVKKKNKSKSN